MSEETHNAPGTFDQQAGATTLQQLVAQRKVIVCVGSGGVGKTTSAATIGLAAAARGRRTLVITIDPARRLANALGLTALGHRPQAVDAALVQRAAGTSSTSPATLHAMMLDLKEGWDDMMRRTAPDDATAEQIFQNRFYKVLSTELPGAHEFIACEHLQHLASSGQYDLVVLDTPPTQNALDFLDAPSRILGVLDNDAFKFFADQKRERRFNLGFLDGAASKAQSVIARFTGAELLDDLSAFLSSLKDLYEPLTTRTKAFVALLASKETAFVVVTAPQPSALHEAAFFVDELTRRRLPLSAMVLNRLTPAPVAAEAILARDDGHFADNALSRLLGADVAANLGAVVDEAVAEERRLFTLEQAAMTDAARSIGRSVAPAGGRGLPTVHLPRLPDDLQDADRLLALVPALGGPPAA